MFETMRKGTACWTLGSELASRFTLGSRRTLIVILENVIVSGILIRYSSLITGSVGEVALYDKITAWSTLALAALSLVSCFIVYWGIKRQTESFAQSVSADLGFKLNDRFDGPALKDARKKATEALLENKKTADIDDLFDFFETIGFYVDRGLLDERIAHTLFFHWINLYWVAGKDQIENNQAASKGIWVYFGKLYDRLLAIEIADDPKSRDINPSEERIRQLLKYELQ
jgi:hypothetical protein